MSVPDHLLRHLGALAENERFLAISGLHGVHCFNVTIRGESLTWESHPDDFHGTGFWAYGTTTVSSAQAAEFAQLFDACRVQSKAPMHDAARMHADLVMRSGGQLLHHGIPIHGRSPVDASSPPEERLSHSLSRLIATWAEQAPAHSSHLCFATQDLGPQWVDVDAIVMIRLANGGRQESVRCKRSELGELEAPLSSLLSYAVPVEAHRSQREFAARLPAHTGKPAFLVAVRSNEGVRLVQSPTSNAAFDAVFEALQARSKVLAAAAAHPPVKTAPARADSGAVASSTATVVKDRAELERRLGGVYRLDGSFFSLWAVEEVMIAVRRVPQLASHVPWITGYLADLFERAFREMGMRVERDQHKIIVREPIEYQVEVAEHVSRLVLDPPKPLPTFFGIRWLGGNAMGTAIAPWYGLSNIFQNNAWAFTQHAMIGQQRDRMDRAVPWLTREYVRGLQLDTKHGELATQIARAMVWPPLGYPQNDYGEHNLPRLRSIVEGADGASARAVLDAFVACQDRSCQLLAAATAIHFAIPPDTRHEACVYRDAAQHFGITSVPPFIQAAIEKHAANMETPNVDADHPVYRAVYEAPPAQGLQRVRQVLEREPNLPTFHNMAGRHAEALGDTRAALQSYDRALELKGDYVQAHINRGSLLSMQKDFARGDADFFAARKIRPEDPDLRSNLLINYLFTRDQEKKSASGPVSAKAAASAPAKPLPEVRAADPASAEVLAQQKGTALRQLLRKYGDKQIDLDSVMRAVMSHEHYLLPASQLPPNAVHKHAIMFSRSEQHPARELWAFTDLEAAQRAQATCPTLGIFATGHGAAMLMIAFDPRKFSQVRINPGGPEEEGWIMGASSIGLLHAWSTGLAVESAARTGRMADLRFSLSHHPALMVALRDGALVLTRSPSGGVYAQVAATIDRSRAMSQQLGGAQAAPLSPSMLLTALERAGAVGFVLAGDNLEISKELLRPPN